MTDSDRCLPFNGTVIYVCAVGLLAVGATWLLVDWLKRRKESLGHISLTDFICEAAKIGWDVTGKTNAHILDLMYGIRQSAHDGEIVLRGRLDPFGTGTLSNFQIKTPIPGDHWTNYEIDWRRDAENWEIGTISTNDMSKRGRYLDLELENPAASRWLAAKSAVYRGWHETKDRRLRHNF